MDKEKKAAKGYHSSIKLTASYKVYPTQQWDGQMYGTMHISDEIPPKIVIKRTNLS